jgi:uncharacterized protein
LLDSGPRQSGKTTLARRFAKQDREYITLDNQFTVAAAKSDPVALYAASIEPLLMRSNALLIFCWQSNKVWTRTGGPDAFC